MHAWLSVSQPICADEVCHLTYCCFSSLSYWHFSSALFKTWNKKYKRKAFVYFLLFFLPVCQFYFGHAATSTKSIGKLKDLSDFSTLFDCLFFCRNVIAGNGRHWSRRTLHRSGVFVCTGSASRRIMSGLSSIFRMFNSVPYRRRFCAVVWTLVFSPLRGCRNLKCWLNLNFYIVKRHACVLVRRIWWRGVGVSWLLQHRNS